MILGYFTYFLKNQRLTINKFINAAMWTLSFSIIFATIFGKIPIQTDMSGSMSQGMVAFYFSTSRVGFILSLSWIIFACQQLKTGGIVRWFLCLPHWKPMSRIGLSIYLVHIFVQIIHVGHQQNPTFYSNFLILSVEKLIFYFKFINDVNALRWKRKKLYICSILKTFVRKLFEILSRWFWSLVKISSSCQLCTVFFITLSQYLSLLRGWQNLWITL